MAVREVEAVKVPQATIVVPEHMEFNFDGRIAAPSGTLKPNYKVIMRLRILNDKDAEVFNEDVKIKNLPDPPAGQEILVAATLHCNTSPIVQA